MSNTELLNSILKRNGVRSITENTSKNKKSRLKESDILYKDLDNLVVESMRELLKTFITESAAPDNQKMKNVEIIEKTQFTEQEVLQFMENTIDPIVETVGFSNFNRMLTSGNKAKTKGISLPLYEIALTLESARLGALSYESLEDVPITEDVGPVIDEVGENAEANNLKGEVDPDQQDLDDLVDGDIDQTYNFGELIDDVQEIKEMSENDLYDMHQYDDNDMYELDSGSHPNQSKNREDEVDFNDESDIEAYEGDEGGNPEDGLFDRPMMEASKAKFFNRFFREAGDPEGDYTDEDVYIPKNDGGIKAYRGDVGGEEGRDADDESAYAGEGEGFDGIVEAQVVIAKKLLGRIFKEYGINKDEVKRSMVREAVHYLFKHGVDNIYPAVSDVSHLVSEQNKLNESYNIPDSRYIVENTIPYMTELHEATIEGKSSEMLQALANSKEMTAEKVGANQNFMNDNITKYTQGNVDNESLVKESIAYVCKANKIDRIRQAFRYRMNKFNESAKTKLASGWVLTESNNTPTASQLKNEITVFRYVSEASDMREFFATLREDSPIYRSEIKKSALNNDKLTTTAIVTEVAGTWAKIKENYYNDQPHEIKILALESMLQAMEGYKNLCSAMANPDHAKAVLENFEYRLQSLHDKVLISLNG